MDRSDLLKTIAEKAYDIGFGAKKHMATYDIVVKVPGAIRLFSITVGIYSLAFDSISNKFLSASLVVLGVISLYISFYDSQKDKYESVGVKLIQLFNDLKKLYFQAKAAEEKDFPGILESVKDVENQYYEVSISKQILFSDWYTHYKFFWQYQIEWIDEQKKFKLFRDKVPLTFLLAVLVSLLALSWWIVVYRLLLLNQAPI